MLSQVDILTLSPGITSSSILFLPGENGLKLVKEWFCFRTYRSLIVLAVTTYRLYRNPDWHNFLLSFEELKALVDEPSFTYGYELGLRRTNFTKDTLHKLHCNLGIAKCQGELLFLLHSIKVITAQNSIGDVSFVIKYRCCSLFLSASTQKTFSFGYLTHCRLLVLVAQLITGWPKSSRTISWPFCWPN